VHEIPALMCGFSGTFGSSGKSAKRLCVRDFIEKKDWSVSGGRGNAQMIQGIFFQKISLA
jgi:hypothetical protein